MFKSRQFFGFHFRCVLSLIIGLFALQATPYLQEHLHHIVHQKGIVHSHADHHHAHPHPSEQPQQQNDHEHHFALTSALPAGSALFQLAPPLTTTSFIILSETAPAASLPTTRASFIHNKAPPILDAVAQFRLTYPHQAPPLV